MTVADRAARIERQLAVLEQQLRADLEATGPEDQDALDRLADPSAAWGRLTVEEVLIGIRLRLDATEP